MSGMITSGYTFGNGVNPGGDRILVAGGGGNYGKQNNNLYSEVASS
jgi:hypothetical protein